MEINRILVYHIRQSGSQDRLPNNNQVYFDKDWFAQCLNFS